MFRPVTHGPWSPRALTAEGVASVAVHNCTNPSMAQKYIACFKSPGGEWCLRGNTQEEQGARERQSNVILQDCVSMETQSYLPLSR